MREPIAIVGRGCVLPGADSPEKLGQLFNQNKIVIDHAPKDYWRLKNPIEFLNSKQAEFSWHDLGGYVREFNFNSNEFDLGEYASDLKFLDDGIKWLLYATKQAFVEAGYNAKRYPTCGVVLGNLSYPSHAFSRYCESVWFHTLFGKRFDNVPAINRFCSGTPAHILAKAFGLGRSAFSLDAACASSIYALRFACDALIEGRADLMLAAGLNHADDLFIHAGFTALQALSKQGESLPFGDKADGLIPAEGCAVVLLKRLADAERDGDTIHCIVRAIGLSNSGRSRTVLAPSVEAQVKSMELAYVESAIEPSTVQHMECHATGTIVGDAVELESIRRVFKHNRRLSLSSSKLNIGHSITVSGLVSLLRLTEAMRQNTLPNHPVPEPISDLQESSLNLIQTFKSWDSEGPRRAAINNFGFGGTNAHCVIDEWVVGQSYETFQLSKTDEICVVAMEMSSGKLANLDAHIGTDDASLTARQSELGNFSFSYTDLTIPPVDLEKSLAQHNLVLHLVINACQQIEEMPDRDRVAVFVGMGCDTQGARSGFRWRLYDLLNHYNIILTTEELEQLKASTGLLVDFESAIGVMPNIPANRINQIFDWRAMSCTISSEEVSGLDALDLAIDALKTCRIDMAIVAAIEIGSEQAHQHALKTITGHDIVCMDAGAVLVLKRESIVNESNETIHAKFHDSIGTHAKPIDCPDWMNKYNFHAASGLLALAGSILRAQTMEKIEKDIDSKNYYRFEYSSFTQQQRHFHFSVATNSVAIRLEKGKQKETSTTQLCIPVMANNFQPWAERLPSNDHYVMQAAPRLVLCSTPVLEKSLTSQAENKTLNQPQLTRKNLNISPSKTHVNQLMQGLLEGHEQYLAAQAKAMKAYINTQDALIRKVFFVKPLENQLKIRTETTNHEKEKIKTRSYPFTTHAVNGPVFNRNQLEVLASGRVSQIFGEKFSFQDQYSKQVRMPKPPLLLADKVLGIEAKPLAMQHGIIWTETTIKANEWYLHNNRLLPGLLIESGQADLLLISWLGVDLENQGQRVYRLLGCELSFHQQKLPQAGDQLVFEIRIIQHSKLGDVRLFFFEYDCWLNGSLFFSVREGQAGFFSQTALDRSAGVVISDECSFLDPLATWRRQSHGEQIHFSAEQLEQLRQGNAFACFGSGFEKLAAHNHTPSIPGGRMALFHEIECLIFKGGPWGKGYAKAIYQVQADDWYFQGHFLNDPCMPGTLMADVSIQLINFFMLASGDSLERDAWHFEPLINSKAKFVCRGQVTPDSKSIQYEIFVRQHSNNQIPFVEASVLVSCDGLRIFYCPSISVRMSPGFLSDYRILDYKNVTPTYVDEVNSVRGDFDGLLHSAIGQPSLALGDKYKKYDNGLRCPRLPGPPYQFITQIHSVSHASGEIANNARLNAIYEFSGDEWYFKDEPLNTMPFAVLLEVCLQPCGWLSSHMGFALPSKKDLFFRNLDGALSGPLPPIKAKPGKIHSTVDFTGYSQLGELVIVNFVVTATLNQQALITLETRFGFFTQAAFATQSGVKLNDTLSQLIIKDSDYYLSLDTCQQAFKKLMPRNRLSLIQAITGYWPNAGKNKLGVIRAQQNIDPASWYFKAHFFSDPVQPGSLGFEAMQQTLRCFVLLRHKKQLQQIKNIEFFNFSADLEWRYRGQVVPNNKKVETIVEICEEIHDGQRIVITAEAYLIVDDLPVYSCSGLTIQYEIGAVEKDSPKFSFDLEKQPWLLDHCPNYIDSVVPITVLADLMAQQACQTFPQSTLVGIRFLEVKQWVQVSPELHLIPVCNRTSENCVSVELYKPIDGLKVKHRQLLVSGEFEFAENYTSINLKLESLKNPTALNADYNQRRLFHGPALQCITALWKAENGACSEIAAEFQQIDIGILNPKVLDAAIHSVPYELLAEWFPNFGHDRLGLPYRLEDLRIYADCPHDGVVRCEIRPYEWQQPGGSPKATIHLFVNNRLWLQFVLVARIFHHAFFFRLPRERVQNHVLARRFEQALLLSEQSHQPHILKKEKALAAQWIPGGLQRMYQTCTQQWLHEIAVKEAFAKQFLIHPRFVKVEDNFVVSQQWPLTIYHFETLESHLDISVNFETKATWHREKMLTHWQSFQPNIPPLVEAIQYKLVSQFVRNLVYQNADTQRICQNQPVLYLANHQIMLESMLFIALQAAQAISVKAIARAEINQSLTGGLFQLLNQHPFLLPMQHNYFFNRADPVDLLRVLNQYKADQEKSACSLLVHVEGRRNQYFDKPIKQMSSVLIDLAMELNMPIVPVKFAGGLPSQDNAQGKYFEFPWELGSQIIFIGEAILPEELRQQTLPQRRDFVLERINRTGYDDDTEKKNLIHDHRLLQNVKNYAAKHDLSFDIAVLHQVLTADAKIRSLLETTEQDDSEWAQALIHILQYRNTVH